MVDTKTLPGFIGIEVNYKTFDNLINGDGQLLLDFLRAWYGNVPYTELVVRSIEDEVMYDQSDCYNEVHDIVVERLELTPEEDALWSEHGTIA